VKTAVLFHTCLINEFFPDAGFAVVSVLEHLGYEVQVPRDQTCCGQPAFNAGFSQGARAAACHTVELLETTTGPVVIPSGSCADMVIHHFGEVLADDNAWRDRAKAVASRCVEFSAFVYQSLDRLPVTRLETSVAYHASCHLARGLAIDREPRALVEAVCGSEARPLAAADECCGFGGLFSIKHADISSRMLERKLDDIVASGADRVVSCDMGCLLHIGGGLRRRGAAIKVQHLAELLAEALG
jgi:L-lactate dehydrogenase complex protein LldE